MASVLIILDNVDKLLFTLVSTLWRMLHLRECMILFVVVYAECCMICSGFECCDICRLCMFYFYFLNVQRDFFVCMFQYVTD